MNKDLLNIVSRYFIEIDNSLEKLSHGKEEYIKSLPSWVLCHRIINIIHFLGTDNYMIEVMPDDSLEKDRLEYKEIEEKRGWRGLIAVSEDLLISDGVFEGGIEPGDIAISGGPLGLFQEVFRGKRNYLKGNIIPIRYSIDSAKSDTINIWNASINSLPNSNFIGALNDIFKRFTSIISHEAFREKKTHR